MDCFAAAQELERADRVAQTAWRACSKLSAVPREHRAQPYRRVDSTWLSLYHRAGLPTEGVAQALVERLGPGPERSMEDRGVALSIRVWTGDTRTWIADWLAWVQTCAKADRWDIVKHFRGPVGSALGATGRMDAFREWAESTWDWLKDVPGDEAETLRVQWNWERFNVWRYLHAGDLDAAEGLAWQAIEELGYAEYGQYLIEIAARRGEPTPPELARLVREEGREVIDSYGKWGWYFVAREAAAAGDESQAFEALRRALNYWTNPPLIDVRSWEDDGYWGDLREHAEYQRIYAEKRQRIGPIYGWLWYFPGW